MIDQASAAEIMYLDLFKGLGLKLEDLTTYSSPLVSFEGKMVVPRGQIRLPVQTGSDLVEVDFIVVDAFSRIRPSWVGLGCIPWVPFPPPFIRK